MDAKMNYKDAYFKAIEIRNFEIELFWKRSLFFWGFVSAAFIAYATFSTSGSIKTTTKRENITWLISETVITEETTKSDQENLYSLLIACFGFICSFVWTLANRGNKQWQENWEITISNLEAKLFINENGDIKYRQKDFHYNNNFFLFNDLHAKLSHKSTWLKPRPFSVSKLAIAFSDFTVLIWAVIIITNILNHFSAIIIIILTIIYAFIIYNKTLTDEFEDELKQKIENFNGCSDKNNSITLSWKGLQMKGIKGFVIYKNDKLLTSFEENYNLKNSGLHTDVQEYSYTDPNVYAGHKYTYTLEYYNFNNKRYKHYGRVKIVHTNHNLCKK